MGNVESDKNEQELPGSFNNTFLSNLTETNLPSNSQENSSDTWDNRTLVLNQWQKTRLEDAHLEPGIRCHLENWIKYDQYIFDTEAVYCNATWDKVYCWPSTLAGTRISRPCSETLENSHPEYAKYLEGNAIRVCLDNGSWSQGLKTNYDMCTASYETWADNVENTRNIYQFVRQMVFIGSILSLLSLGTAFVIFFKFKRLWSQRTKVHVHLMAALTLRFSLLYVITEPFIFNRQTTYRDYDVLCKLIMSAYLYSNLASVMWMLIQGIYINGKLTTNVLVDESKNKFRFYYFLGWGFPILTVAVYLVFMVFSQHSEKCWRGYSEMTEIWIILIPTIIALTQNTIITLNNLLLNGVLLLNILRVVIKSTRRLNSNLERSRLRSVAKATLVLFPVLGVNNLLLLCNPGGEYDKYFVSLNTFFGSMQGVFVATVFCFSRSEVHQAIRLSYQQFLVRRHSQPTSTLISFNHSRISLRIINNPNIFANEQNPEENDE